jgi:hypothetical protein
MAYAPDKVLQPAPSQNVPKVVAVKIPRDYYTAVRD